MDTQDTQGDQRRRVQPGQEELSEATRAFMSSLVHTGRNITLSPITRLPPDSRQHFLAAGREFTRGWAALIRGLADGIDGLANETRAPTRSGTDGRTSAGGHTFVRTHDKD
jgi:hypothetical protein